MFMYIYIYILCVYLHIYTKLYIYYNSIYVSGISINMYYLLSCITSIYQLHISYLFLVLGAHRTRMQSWKGFAALGYDGCAS